MTLVKDKCAMFGCQEPTYQVLTLGPGTSLRLCLKHYTEEGGTELPESGQATPLGAIIGQMQAGILPINIPSIPGQLTEAALNHQPASLC
jgi:hypothetical protein